MSGNGQLLDAVKHTRALFSLPSTWSWATVGEITENLDGRRVPLKSEDRDQRSGQYPYYGASGIIDDIDDYLFDGAHLLIAEDGANLLSRSTPIAFQASGKFWVNNHAHVVLTRGCIPLSYLELYLNRLDLQFFISGTAQPKLNQANLNKIPVPVAPLPEQRRIVAKIEELFSDLDAGVVALERAKAKLKRYRAAVLKAAVEGKLTEEWRAKHPAKETGSQLLERILKERRRHWESEQLAAFEKAGKNPPANWKTKYKEPAGPDGTNLPALPEGWCWATLDAIAAIDGGLTKDQKRPHTATTREVPYLRVANVQRGYLDLHEIKMILAEEEEIQALRLKEGDILFTEGGDRDKLGRGWVWNSEIVECIHQNHVFRARLLCQQVQPKFISYHGNYFGQRWFVKTGKQTTNLASINKGVLSRFPVPLPPSDEQRQIVAEVERRFSILDEAQSQIDADLKRSTRLRQSILKRAFEGKLVPQDPKDEQASLLLERIKVEKADTNGKAKPRKTK